MIAARRSRLSKVAGDEAARVRDAHDLTRLIQAWRGGDGMARDALIARVYANVRAIAAQSRRSMPGATLGTTELAHEALLRLLGDDAPWEDRKHFFHVAAQATRQVLVDAARRRLAAKRGGGAEHVELEASLDVPDPQADVRLVKLDDALHDLAANDARRARVVELVYFGGLNRAEVAGSLALSEATVDHDLRVARAWLRSALED
ncbi:MAG: sigma-70 family RNA polymerase sigma factor [Proteobacteria bacterium]|nr:sigma-70 family RNA polymerase sigma factor [Pseudomonadota bacterium]